MTWVIRPLKEGDHIRVNRILYYHHGVYIGNNRVIHYTSTNGDGLEHPELVHVQETSLEFFAKNGIVEVAQPSLAERIYVRSKSSAVDRAKAGLGRGDYSFFHNNCETFANECCYTKQLTSQIDDLKKKL